MELNQTSSSNFSGSAQTAAAAMAAGQGGIIYANGVPCMVQGGSASVMPLGHNAAMLPLQDGLAFPQLVRAAYFVFMMFL